MKWFNNSAISLKVKLPSSIVGIVVITFIISTAFTFYNFTSVVQSVTDSHLESTAQNIGESISTQIRQAGRDMVMAASLPHVLQAIEFPPMGTPDPKNHQIRIAMTVLFERILLAYGYYNALYLVNDLGQYILGTQPTVNDLTTGEAGKHFKDAMSKSGFNVGPTIFNIPSNQIIMPIFLEVVYNGYRGALVSSLQISKIANTALLSNPHNDIIPLIFALNNDQTLMVAQHEQINLPEGNWKEELKKSPSGVLRIHIGSHEYTMGFYQIPQTDLYAITLAKPSFMSAPSTILRTSTLIINLVAVLVIMLFLFLLTGPITEEIAQLSRFAKAVTHDKEDVSIATQRQDELGNLAHSLGKMVSKLKDMVVRSEAATKAKSDFLACMSHEIRTPMNGILGMTHLALKANPDQTQKEYLLRIDTAAKTLLGVINDILDFSKIEAEKLDINNTTFRISGILASMRDMLHERAQDKGLKLTFTVDDTVPDIIYSDPLRFAQICINLCSNAIKFTSQGEVSVHIFLVEKKDDHIQLQVNIKDTGIGIAPNDQSKIFDSFSQADGTTTRQYGGTGLGLTISKSLVHLLGGEIGVQSELHKGSTFYFTIRTKEGLPTDLEEKNFTEHAENTLPELKILLVEDNEINQEIALELLKSMGAKVTLANNGAEGVAAFEKEYFDIILMDIQMPIMDGISAAQTIRQSAHPMAKKIPIIAMTAHAMTGDREKSLEAGMNDHITKPIDINALHSTLEFWGCTKQS